MTAKCNITVNTARKERNLEEQLENSVLNFMRDVSYISNSHICNVLKYENAKYITNTIRNEWNEKEWKRRYGKMFHGKWEFYLPEHRIRIPRNKLLFYKHIIFNNISL